MSMSDWKEGPMQYPRNQEILLERMDKAFGHFSEEADKLSVLLAAKRDPFSWTSYHDLIRQKTLELVAYEQYRKIQEELFALINPPKPEVRRESSVSWVLPEKAMRNNPNTVKRLDRKRWNEKLEIYNEQRQKNRLHLPRTYAKLADITAQIVGKEHFYVQLDVPLPITHEEVEKHFAAMLKNDL
jgi:hypothetical protein